MQICLDKNWKLAGAWPYTPLKGNSMETGVALQGVTPEIDARVPGSVHADLLRAGIIEDPYYECNSLLCEWVSNRFWSYQTTFVVPEEYEGKNIRLVFKGIDYHAHILLNKKKIGEHIGMYAPCVIDITDKVMWGKENSLVVVLQHAPDEMGQVGYTSQTFTQKSRFGYKWDFATRLVDLGLYDIVYLDISDEPLEDVHIRYLGDGKVQVTAKNKGLKARLCYQGEVVAEATSEQCAEGCKLLLQVEEPKLWWPNGYGEQPLYDLTLQTTDDEKTYRIGLRTLEYRKPECDDKSVLPYIPVINGKEVYIKGVNITPLDHMYGTVNKERYRKLLCLAKSAHVNLIRVWGGGLIEKEEFYEVCDELGLMVWQDFIQSSTGLDNQPSHRKEFLELCEQTARAVIPEKRNHTSLTFWCGGNELMSENNVPSTFEDKNVAMLKEIVEELSPEILFLPTTASGPVEWFDREHAWRNQDVHGPWRYEGVEKQYAFYNQSTIILHSEYGVDGMSNLDAIKTVLSPDNQRVTTMDENFVWRHHGEWWDSYKTREKPLFGEIDSLEDLVNLSQYMQAEGIRYAVEANRRRSKGVEPARLAEGEMVTYPMQNNVGSIIWQLNEPWPNVACTCLVDYYEQPKLAYHFYTLAQEPLHISMRYEKFLWKAGEVFEGTLFVHDDLEEGYDRVEAEVLSEKGLVETRQIGNRLTFVVPEEIQYFQVNCKLCGKDTVYHNTYLFLVGDMGRAPKRPIVDCVREYMKKI